MASRYERTEEQNLNDLDYKSVYTEKFDKNRRSYIPIIPLLKKCWNWIMLIVSGRWVIDTTNWQRSIMGTQLIGGSLRGLIKNQLKAILNPAM